MYGREGYYFVRDPTTTKIMPTVRTTIDTAGGTLRGFLFIHVALKGPTFATSSFWW